MFLLPVLQVGRCHALLARRPAPDRPRAGPAQGATPLSIDSLSIYPYISTVLTPCKLSIFLFLLLAISRLAISLLFLLLSPYLSSHLSTPRLASSTSVNVSLSPPAYPTHTLTHTSGVGREWAGSGFMRGGMSGVLCAELMTITGSHRGRFEALHVLAPQTQGGSPSSELNKNIVVIIIY